jgi:hypothetical protein
MPGQEPAHLPMFLLQPLDILFSEPHDSANIRYRIFNMPLVKGIAGADLSGNPMRNNVKYGRPVIATNQPFLMMRTPLALVSYFRLDLCQ